MKHDNAHLTAQAAFFFHRELCFVFVLCAAAVGVVVGVDVGAPPLPLQYAPHHFI